MGNSASSIEAPKETQESMFVDRFQLAVRTCYSYCMGSCHNGAACSVPANEVQETKDVYRHYTDEIHVPAKQTVPVILENVYQDCTYENTPAYSYEHMRKMVKVLRVLDGDTVDIALYYEETGKIFKHRVRLYGIDTPEKHPLRSDPEREKEIAASKRASEALIGRLKENNDLVIALFYKADKYGRLLCTLYDKQGDNINQWMVQSGFAYEYFGKTKKAFHETSAKQTLSECDQHYFETQKVEEPADSADDFEEITNEMKS
jgi:endonuclease YncB( thermonuclease family)